MKTKNTHWPSILILAALGLGLSFVLLIFAGAIVSSVFDLFSGKGDAVGEMISASAFGFVVFVLLLCGWLVLQKAMGREQADLPILFPFADWQILAVIGIVLASLTIGAVVAYTEITWLAWIVLPLLTLTIILPPIWLFFGIGAKGIGLGPRWRVSGILGLGLTVGPAAMITLEIIALVVIIIGASILLAVRDPALAKELMDVAKALRNESDPEVILNLLTPYISNGAVIAALLGYVGLLVPLIEELLKPLGVWLFAKKIDSPAQGFVMGILSGAAFAMIESLNASSDGSLDWPLIVSVRAGTSLLHMTTSGLVGWGIVSAFGERRYGRLPASYISAVLLHGLWNSCAIGAGLSVLGGEIGRPEWFFTYISAALGGMFVLGIGMFIVLIASNRKLRIGQSPPPLPPVEMNNGGVQ